MKIGILGGSFDPIHNGHMNMAIQAMEEYALDQVWLMPAGHSPNKNEADMTSAEDRLKMCNLAASSYENILVNTYEFLSQETSYTYLTLTHFHETYPEDEFYFIMGADSLDYFDKWRHPEIICENAVVLVVNRNQFLEEDLLHKIGEIQSLFPADIRIVHCDKVDVSSTELRNGIKEGKDVAMYLCPEVLTYITQNGLYKGK